EAGRVSVRRPSRSESAYHDATVCATGWPMDCEHRAGSELLWHPLTPADQSDSHLPPYWQPAGGTAFAGAQENREHGALSRHRGRRRSRDSRTDRRLKYGGRGKSLCPSCSSRTVPKAVVSRCSEECRCNL